MVILIKGEHFKSTVIYFLITTNKLNILFVAIIEKYVPIENFLFSNP